MTTTLFIVGIALALNAALTHYETFPTLNLTPITLPHRQGATALALLLSPLPPNDSASRRTRLKSLTTQTLTARRLADVEAQQSWNALPLSGQRLPGRNIALPLTLSPFPLLGRKHST